MGFWFQRRWQTAAHVLTIGLVLGLAEDQVASAHEGPPFPIAVDEPLAGLVVSIWADPDIGDGVLYVVVESPSGGAPEPEPRVTVWVEPVDGRLERVEYEATRQALRHQRQFLARPTFDQRDRWNVGIRLTTAAGKSAELTRQVESTPPGFGLWDFAIYLFPFLLLGGMWMLAVLRHRRRTAVASSAGEQPHKDGLLNCHEVKHAT